MFVEQKATKKYKDCRELKRLKLPHGNNESSLKKYDFQDVKQNIVHRYWRADQQLALRLLYQTIPSPFVMTSNDVI